MKVLSSRLTDDSGVASKAALNNALGNLPIQMAENGCGARIVEGGELLMCKDGLGDLFGVPGDELDDVGGKAGLEEDLLNEVVAVNGIGGGFPDDNVAHERGGGGEVAADGGEVEGRDGIDEAFEGAVFNAAIG